MRADATTSDEGQRELAIAIVAFMEMVLIDMAVPDLLCPVDISARLPVDIVDAAEPAVRHYALVARGHCRERTALSLREELAQLNVLPAFAEFKVLVLLLQLVLKIAKALDHVGGNFMRRTRLGLDVRRRFSARAACRGTSLAGGVG